MTGHIADIRLVDAEGNALNADCPGREIFNHITSRWALLIVIALGEAPLRFHVLRERVEGVSEKMLSQTLKTLARDGLVTRHVEPAIPPQVSYDLTPMGRELSDLFQRLILWIGKNFTDIADAQARYDGRQ